MRISDWSSDVCSSDLWCRRRPWASATRSGRRRYRPSQHDQVGVERAGFLEGFEDRDEIRRRRADRVDRLDDVGKLRAGIEQEHRAHLLVDRAAAVLFERGLALAERRGLAEALRSAENTSELQSLM